jgi:type VI protein secretion system component VasK
MAILAVAALAMAVLTVAILVVAALVVAALAMAVLTVAVLAVTDRLEREDYHSCNISLVNFLVSLLVSLNLRRRLIILFFHTSRVYVYPTHFKAIF